VGDHLAERAALKLGFVSLLATDKVKLPGLLYQPDKKTHKAAVWLHGMGDNGTFYNPKRLNALGEALAKNDIGFLAFNNRGAHNRKSLHVDDDMLPEEDRRYLGGTHYELIADCVKDIAGAANLLAQRGFSELYLIGHSSGANKICAYHARARNNPFKKYVLAAPGDDLGLFFMQLGEKRYWQALKYAAAKIDGGDPLHIMPKYTGMYPFSAQSAHDILDPNGAYNTCPYYESLHQRLGEKPLFKEYRSIDKPTLVIFGWEDEYMGAAGGAEGALKILMRHTSNAQLKQTDFLSVAGAGHGFHDHEEEFAEKVSDWLAYD
jgi:pimeloyl-ACP methyl ester carboxylesterase